MRASRESTIAVAVTALLALPLLTLSSQVAGAMGIDRPYDFVHVPHGRGLALLAPGPKLSIANLYWLSAVQYVGDRGASRRGYEKLLPVVDLVTDLDPRHGYAYQSAGIFLSSQRDADASDRILEKGFRQGPPWWSFPYYRAFNAVFYRQDHEDAARWAERAARTPGAPSLARDMAFTLQMKSGSRDDAVRMIEDLRATVTDENTAAALEEQHRLAVLQRDFARLDAGVARFRAERGRPPSSLDELVRERFLDAVPREPYGGRYYLDPRDGRVHASANDLRIEPTPRNPPLAPSSPPESR
jgi:hypothetical protein